MNSSTSGCVHVLIFHFAYDKTNEHNIEQYPFSLKSTHVQQNTFNGNTKNKRQLLYEGLLKLEYVQSFECVYPSRELSNLLSMNRVLP